LPATLFPRSGTAIEVAVESLPRGYSRVWLILSFQGPEDEVLTNEVLDPRLRRLYPSVQETELPRIRVRLYGQRPAGPR
jgi:hypothetical protein